MAVTWIQEIYNNTDRPFVMWARDDEHLGEFEDLLTGETLGCNDDDRDFIIRPHSRIKAHWCGVPWYQSGNAYRGLVAGEKRQWGLRIFQSDIDGTDMLFIVDGRNGKTLTSVPIGSPAGPDRDVALIIMKDGIDFLLREKPMGPVNTIFEVGGFLWNAYKEVVELNLKILQALGAVIS